MLVACPRLLCGGAQQGLEPVYTVFVNTTLVVHCIDSFKHPQDNANISPKPRLMPTHKQYADSLGKQLPVNNQYCT